MAFARRFSVVLVMLLTVGAASRGHTAVVLGVGSRDVIAGQAPPGRMTKWTFDDDTVGGLPKGATAFSGHRAVRAESGTPSSPNALCQTGRAEFPALALGETVFTDVRIEAAFKPISGREDQAAGIIFRIQDKDNYYIVRANALEDNVNAYKYVRGRRIFLKGTSVKVVSGKWHVLGAEVIGSRIRGSLNGQPVVEATDETFKGGEVGLWTKADSVTCFDDVRVTSR